MASESSRGHPEVPCYLDLGKEAQAFLQTDLQVSYLCLFLPGFCLDLFSLSYVPHSTPRSVLFFLKARSSSGDEVFLVNTEPDVRVKPRCSHVACAGMGPPRPFGFGRCQLRRPGLAPCCTSRGTEWFPGAETQALGTSGETAGDELQTDSMVGGKL